MLAGFWLRVKGAARRAIVVQNLALCATPRAYSLQGLSPKTSGGSFNSRLVSDVDVWQAAERALKQPTPAPPYYRRGPLSL